MRHGVFGTGMVGQAIAGKLLSLGHDVRMGARDAKNEKAAAFVAKSRPKASHGTFADAAAFGEMLWNCTSGVGTMPALNSAGAEHLKGKVLVDVSNPLDFSKGMPPQLSTASGDSVAEQIQRAFPSTKVVKALNTINCQIMVDANRVADGQHDVFIAGNEESAKGAVSEILRNGFGWKNIVDLGDITAARATEAYVLFWVRLMGALKTVDFNIHIVR